MTVCAALMGLLRILGSTGTGADVMKRIVAPMVGGLFEGRMPTPRSAPARAAAGTVRSWANVSRIAHVLILEPRELLRRLATLVPPPRAHLVRYHGIFGPASKWRREIAPAPPQSACPAEAPCSSNAPDTSRPPPTTKPPRPLDSRIPWSELLLRVFREDILACPCGGRRKVIAFSNERPVIERILGHLGLPTTGPPIAPARLPALADASLW